MIYFTVFQILISLFIFKFIALNSIYRTLSSLVNKLLKLLP